MTKTWIAIITRGEARIFNAESLAKIVALKSSVGREKNRAFTSDKPGLARNRSLSKGSTHALSGEKNPHDDAAKTFALKINEYLKKRFHERRFDEVIICAEPRMQGWIKSGMGKRLMSHSRFKPLDLGNLSDHEIKKRFAVEEAVV